MKVKIEEKRIVKTEKEIPQPRKAVNIRRRRTRVV